MTYVSAVLVEASSTLSTDSGVNVATVGHTWSADMRPLLPKYSRRGRTKIKNGVNRRKVMTSEIEGKAISVTLNVRSTLDFPSFPTSSRLIMYLYFKVLNFQNLNHVL